jgi:folate-binding protein YgfZ
MGRELSWVGADGARGQPLDQRLQGVHRRILAGPILVFSMNGMNDLAQGRAFADLSHWRKVRVSGADARTWLNDLISADVSRLGTGQSVRSLLLSPTGRIRAEFTVSMPEDIPLLVQDPSQRSIMDLLDPYTLSSEVDLADLTAELALFALPNHTEAPANVSALSSMPSSLGPGVDLVAPAPEHGRVLASLAGSFSRATEEDANAWRVIRGLPRLGVDVTEQDLPQEAGLQGAVAFDKGCYLGQEAVAKVRNLGHPRRLLLRLEAEAGIAPGDVVLADGREAGALTSVAVVGERAIALARVRWELRGGPFRSLSGVELRLSPAQSPV